MMQFRPFRNSDSPGIAAAWNDQPPLRHRYPAMTPAVLEQYVLSKPYFDPRGLIVAEKGDRVAGFVHAGFQPAERFGELEFGTGIICQLVVAPHEEEREVGPGLLQQGEQYLRERGAAQYLGGAAGDRGPFYLGLYGGSQLPGVLDSDTQVRAVLLESGYLPRRRYVILHRTLADYRPPVDRLALQLRRQFRIEPIPEAEQTPWYDVCNWCWVERDRFAVVSVAGGAPRSTLTFWDMEPLGSSWAVRAAGYLPPSGGESFVPSDDWFCFLAEAMRYFQSQGVGLVEVQLLDPDRRTSEGFGRLGFREVDRGTQFVKPA
jgi:hypothetical protein